MKPRDPTLGRGDDEARSDDGGDHGRLGRIGISHQLHRARDGKAFPVGSGAHHDGCALAGTRERVRDTDGIAGSGGIDDPGRLDEAQVKRPSLPGGGCGAEDDDHRGGDQRTPPSAPPRAGFLPTTRVVGYRWQGALLDGQGWRISQVSGPVGLIASRGPCRLTRFVG